MFTVQRGAENSIMGSLLQQIQFLKHVANLYFEIIDWTSGRFFLQYFSVQRKQKSAGRIYFLTVKWLEVLVLSKV